MPALFVNNLTVLDFTYLHESRWLVGESWIVDVELHGALDQQGMVFDFGHVKKLLKQEVDRLADHCLLLPEAMPGLEVVELPDGNLRILRDHQGERLLIECPPVAVLCLPVAQITEQALGVFLMGMLKRVVPENVEHIVVTLRAEKIDGAHYHYSHGLKKHDGACQRIAHGHRSRIEISENGAPSTMLEARWAGLFQDIYIGTMADMAYTPRAENICFAYVSREGRYLLELHRRHVYLIDSDSTVEHIAQHVAEALKRANPLHSYYVKAYEGVGKGAIGAA